MIIYLGFKLQKLFCHWTSHEELEDSIHFAKVIEYCFGIKEEFSLFGNIDETKAYIDLCFERGFEPHLRKPGFTKQLTQELIKAIYLCMNNI